MSNASADLMINEYKIDHKRHRYPYCVVWTPIPLLTWMFPVIGHMGIATSSGVIRDFAGPYYVSEGNMAFGWPTKYLQLDPKKARGGQAGWDEAIKRASDEYCTRMHNLCFDNCHSHVSMALNEMEYEGCTNWNMFKIGLKVTLFSKYVSFWGFVKQWVPFLVFATLLALIIWVLN